MSNLFSRIKNSIAADFHEVLDKKEEKNPIAMLNQYLRDCEKEVEKVKQLVERQGLLKEEFRKEYEQAKSLSEKRKYQAEVALKAEEMELYEFAIQEQTQYSERASHLHASLEKAKADLQNLEQKYEVMKHKLKDMYIKRMELMGRENVARANHRINSILKSNDTTESLNKFNEMENYLERLETKVNNSYHQHTIDMKIAQLEKQFQNEEKTVSNLS
ncbi:PspA/IM30 family protein [Sutcliffiella cohnii]|uniref:Modulator protein n=1 Tax=Sutcliffiella cohnii TaxID=33932 RepID=A0A223KQA4_9BACI|nr:MULTISPECIES: PspA/IM30 family protein [Sutcliffiella]AST91534.1 modulator protein [Sutcliffiella cohnii]MED4014896.1 PspA/IM30 family protein [Sutcliffiella cohnii]WBL17364.1 PspA/IM30 family protein [Sutcliffiella sp. NC1]